jgi:hypothetical protein
MPTNTQSKAYSEMRFITDWLAPELLVGEEGYYLATFEMALRTLSNISPSADKTVQDEDDSTDSDKFPSTDENLSHDEDYHSLDGFVVSIDSTTSDTKGPTLS